MNVNSQPLDQPARVDQAAAAFNATMRRIERLARSERRSLPTVEERETAKAQFWLVMDALQPGVQNPAAVRRAIREHLHPWLMRSRLWHRAMCKPHGYAGDNWSSTGG